MQQKKDSYKADALSTYLRGLRHCPPLSREEEIVLAKRLQQNQDQDAANRLVRANLRAVVKVASRYQRPGVELLELIQEGSLGLIQAVYRFDPERGVRLVTYACWWIRAYVQRYLQRGQRRLGRLSAAEITRLTEKARAEGRSRPVSAARFSEVSLDQLMEGDARNVIGAIMADDAPSQEATFLDKEAALVRRAAVQDSIRVLDPQEQTVISNRYLREDPRTLKEIGEELGLSRQRIHQIEQRARRKLSIALKGQPTPAIQKLASVI